MNAKNSNKVLITGGCGFIGANLVKYLLQASRYEIRILDNLSSGRKEYLDQILDSINSTKVSERCNATHPTKRPNAINFTNSINRVKLIEGDIRDKDTVEEACEGVSAIVHLASLTGVPDSLKNPATTYQVNVIGTQNLLEACRESGIEKFVFASSNAAVGAKEPPIHEDMVPEPISPYGSSKLAGEALCSAYSHSFGIKAIALRFANVYGPYSDHKTSVISNFIRRAKKGQPLIIYGDGHQTRDFIHVHDICQAVELALYYEPKSSTNWINAKNSQSTKTNEFQPLGSKTQDLKFQIGTGCERSIQSVAKMAQKLAIHYGFPKPKIVYEKPREGDLYKNYTDPSRAQAQLNFYPEFDLETGLKQLWKSYGTSEF